MDSKLVTAYAGCEDKLSKRRKTNVGEDIISNLPEVIIGYILSFLPIVDAVRTSVLSKRWIYMWTFITKIRFSDSLLDFRKSRKLKKCFVEFVYRVLLHLDNSSIQSFSLLLRNNYDPSVVNAWVSTILNRRVQKLYVNSEQKFSFSFHSLFKCESLVELELDMGSCTIRVPTYVCLPYLTVLNLSGITFNCHSSSNSGEVTLIFPVLKKFVTTNCTWLGVKVVTLDAPILEKVLMVQFRSNPLSQESLNCAIKVRASQLTKFRYDGHMLPDTILLDPSTAQSAAANIHFPKYKEEKVEETGIRACKLLKQFNQVKYLAFWRATVLAQAKYSFSDLPEFGMLTHLVLGVVTVEILLGFLLKSPFLKTLVVQKEICKFNKEMLNSAVVPDCLLSTLAVVELEFFNGYEHELYLAIFVIENALVLKKMNISICWTPRQSNRDMQDFKRKLFSCKKGSSSAIIEFLSA